MDECLVDGDQLEDQAGSEGLGEEPFERRTVMFAAADPEAELVA